MAAAKKGDKTGPNQYKKAVSNNKIAIPCSAAKRVIVISGKIRHPKNGLHFIPKKARTQLEHPN
jgi:acyl CoA:acetate/3-ketoacid CoA transferase alpha subunit